MSTRVVRHSVIVAAAFLLLVSAAPVRAQVEVWRSGYNGPVNDWDSYTAMALSPDSALVATGYAVGTSYYRDIVTVKMSRSTGETLWTRTWDGGAGIRDEGVAVSVDDAGNVFVAGKTRSVATDTDFVTLKYLPDGTLAWARRYHYAGVDVPTGIVADGQGGVFVCGRSNATTGNANQDYLTLHYAADSSLLWAARYNGPGNAGDFATAIALDGSGNLYVTGYSWTGSTPQYDYCTVRYDTTDGDTVWVRRYDGTAASPKTDFAYGMTIDDSGYVYVTGRAGEVGTWYDATTVKYDPSGAQEWVNRFDLGGLGIEGGADVGVDADYNVYVAGHTETWETSYDVLIFRIDQSDNSVPWYRTYNYVNDDDSLVAMAVDPAGNCYLLVEITTYEGDYDWATVKYLANGTRAWVAPVQTYDEDDEPADVLVDEQGNVYSAGYNFPVTSENCLVVKYTEDDAGVASVLFPADTFRTRATVTPKAWVRNYSAVAQSFPVRMEIAGGIYYDAQVVSELPAYDSVLVEFTPWPVRDVGTFPVVCYTMLATDKEPGNDTATGVVSGVDVWEFLEPMPVGVKNRGVKDGGALAFSGDSFVFAFKGNNTVEFYRYNIRAREWAAMESIPPVGSTGSKKRVKAGGNLEPDTSGRIYALKGNNTQEFWRYSPTGDSWRELANFPTLASGRRVKGGSGMAYVPSLNRIYAVKGNSTFDFAYFDIRGGAWSAGPSVPAGDRNKKVKDGSVFAYDGDSTLYLLKGGTYEFYSYDIALNTWRTRKPIPNSYVFPKRRKMKKGGSGGFDPEFGRFYAMKGGKVSEFWYFDPAQDSWVSVDDSFPKLVGGKPPYSGADMFYGAGKIYALRGNKTLDFLRYNANLPLEPEGGVQARPAALERLSLAVWPNPVFGRASVRYALPRAGHVRLVLYDVTGRQVRVLVDEWQAAGQRQVAVDARNLAAGVYLARLSAESDGAVLDAGRKILIAR
ncbi:MAG: SBBP repeat-containing protein [bacterium]